MGPPSRAQGGARWVRKRRCFAHLANRVGMAHLPSHPPAVIHLIPVRREAPAIARRAVQQDVPLTTETEKVEDAKLVISELVQNVVLHSSLDDEAEFRVRVYTTTDRIRIEVEDRGSGFSRDELLPPWQDPWSGNGLRVVDAISSRWGAERSAKGGTAAWAEIDR
jgi:hypothetical protein